MADAEVVFLSDSSEERFKIYLAQVPSDMQVKVADIQLSDSEKAKLCKDAKCIVIFPSDISVELVKACPNLKLVQLLSAGYDRIDVREIMELGVDVANNGGANAVSVAEYTVAMMVILYRRLVEQWQAVKAKRWRGGISGNDHYELAGKTVGIIGLGRVGKQVARHLRHWDVSVLYHDVIDMPTEVEEELEVRRTTPEELLSTSDVVTLHVPLSHTTEGLIGRRELEMMKPTALLVNASRGPVVDERALYDALRNGVIAIAGLDVLEEEPTPADNPLLELDNAVITPHLAGVGYDTHVRTARFAFENAKRALAGQKPLSIVEP